ncbi:MAG: hypothetical protein IIA87_04055 [Nanoarchaeota archaeon]|nr:hypothetical protein [Nanoarchaeota archaeon]
MKHSFKVTTILIVMFFVAQLIGIYVANAYLPETIQVVNETTGVIENITQYNLPYGLEPPKDIRPATSAISIITALFIAVIIMLLLMRFKAETFLRLWFLLVVIIGMALAFNAFIIGFENSAIIAIIVAVPLGIIKIFQRNIIVHNATELLIYPGIASVFIPLLNIWTVVFLLIIISIYDIYAVCHAGFMQKMAKYQIEKLRIFSGFFVPYLGKKERRMLKKARKSKTKKGKKIGISIAILGGGDVIFPILLAGVVLGSLGLLPALLIIIGATIALAFLFHISEKGKFYPAMPFIATGCLVGLLIAYLI